MKRFDQCDETCTVDCGHCKGDGPRAPFNTFGGARFVVDSMPPFPPGRRYVALSCACGWRTDWFPIADEHLGAGELRTHCAGHPSLPTDDAGPRVLRALETDPNQCRDECCN